MYIIFYLLIFLNSAGRFAFELWWNILFHNKYRRFWLKLTCKILQTSFFFPQVFTLPNLKNYCKYKLTAEKGEMVRKVATAKFASKTTEPNHEETCLAVTTNQVLFVKCLGHYTHMYSHHWPLLVDCHILLDDFVCITRACTYAYSIIMHGNTTDACNTQSDVFT